MLKPTTLNILHNIDIMGNGKALNQEIQTWEKATKPFAVRLTK